MSKLKVSKTFKYKGLNKNLSKEKVVLILSGGCDSTTLLYDLLNQNYEVYTLSFDYQQKHSIELSKAIETCEKLKVNYKILDLSILNEIAPSALTRKDWNIPLGHYKDENMKQTIVPNRNMIMLSLAISYAIGIKATKVFYGAHAGDHRIYPDCRPAFINAMKKVASLCDFNKIELIAPYQNINKSDIVKKGLKLNVDYSLTQTCYSGKEKACGKCGSCVERLEAFKINHTTDPLSYQ